MDDIDRSKVDAEHLIELLRSEKQELLEQKTELFNVSRLLFITFITLQVSRLDYIYGMYSIDYSTTYCHPFI